MDRDRERLRHVSRRGNEVNLASKLGEDIADLGDVLLTANAYAQVEKQEIKCEERRVSVSGLELTYYAILD